MSGVGLNIEQNKSLDSKPNRRFMYKYYTITVIYILYMKVHKSQCIEARCFKTRDVSAVKL